MFLEKIIKLRFMKANKTLEIKKLHEVKSKSKTKQKEKKKKYKELR